MSDDPRRKMSEKEFTALLSADPTLLERINTALSEWSQALQAAVAAFPAPADPDHETDHRAPTAAELAELLLVIETLTATGGGLSPEETIAVHLLAARARADDPAAWMASDEVMARLRAALHGQPAAPAAADSASRATLEWGWYWGRSKDEEHWRGPLATREEAIAEARNEIDPPVYITRAAIRPQQIADWIGLDELFEQAEEWFSESDLSNPDLDTSPVFDCTEDQKSDLLVAIRTACDAWQARHGLRFVPRVLTEMGLVERIAEEAAE